MALPKIIGDNLYFLITETHSQVSNLQAFLDAPTPALAKRIIGQSGYINSLKTRIHDSSINRISRPKDNESETRLFRTSEFIATALQRISEQCVDCVRQIDNLPDNNDLYTRSFAPLLERVIRGIKLVDPALKENDTRLALKIGHTEHKIDQDYRKLLKYYMSSLKPKRQTEELITAMFIAYSIDQMGDALLNISESIISANLGQDVNMDQFYSIRASAENLDMDEKDINIKSIAETRSGSTVSGISRPDQKGDEYLAIYKDGEKRKLKEERQGVESWHEIYPGLAPRILAYQKQGESAALLIEHLAGQTFEQILLHEPPKRVKETLTRLADTVQDVWQETRTNKPVSACFMKQLSNRIDEVYSVHPEFQQGEHKIGDLIIPSFDTLLDQAMEYERKLRAPFSVYIHGDFNLDNIIFDPEQQRINFIDLHRSRYMDYAQDVSVFMVSNYRLQILDAALRKRIMKVARLFYRIARNYARKSGDETFEIRLALGLARSFATSTRYILDKSLSRAMFLRSRFLIEQVLATDPKKVKEFKTPVKEIFIG
jgi:phosphate uptake regulator/aminoglycoside phosphotransferase (APT) family kinase protein